MRLHVNGFIFTYLSVALNNYGLYIPGHKLREIFARDVLAEYPKRRFCRQFK